MIGIEDAINKYYSRNEKKLKKIFVDEYNDSESDAEFKSRIRSLLKNDAPEAISGAPSSKFKNYKRATEFYNAYLEFKTDNKAYELKEAKKNALKNTPGIFDKIQSLNKKIDKDSFIDDSKDLGRVTMNNVVYNDSLLGYYIIKNSDYVLAKIESQTSGRTKLEHWDFITKEQAGITNAEN